MYGLGLICVTFLCYDNCMASESISIRMEAETRRLLDEEAVARKIGASTLAREILEREVRALRFERARAQVAAAAARMAAEPNVDLWGDVDFFPAEEPA